MAVRFRWVLAAVVMASVAGIGPVVALSDPPSCFQRPPTYTGVSSRVVRGTAGAGPTSERYLAVLPATYSDDPDRRYPVIYLLHGAESTADEWIVCMRLLQLSRSSDVILVLPRGIPTGWWIDWSNGAHLGERALVETLVPHIDATFRTLPHRDRRGIAGLSMGGYGAFVQAARHPEVFGAAASFSGVLRMSDPTLPWGLVAYGATTAFSPGAFADPATGTEWRQAHDPASLVANLEDTTLFLAAGNGVACGPGEVMRYAEPDPSGATLEPLARLDAAHMHRALVARGIHHVYRPYPCGGHTFATFQRALTDAWPILLAATEP